MSIMKTFYKYYYQVKFCQRRFSLSLVFLLPTISFPDLCGASLFSRAVDSPLHSPDRACCWVSRRHAGQKLKPHFWFWHWQCPFCELDIFEGDMHFGHGLSLFLICSVMVWLLQICVVEVSETLLRWSWPCLWGILRFLPAKGNLGRSSKEVDFWKFGVPRFSCKKKFCKIQIELKYVVNILRS